MRDVVRYAVSIVALLCISEVRPAASPLPAPKTGFVTANGIKLHYLDWGGSGDPILFLPGFNDSAHVYNQFALRFTDHFHATSLKTATTRERASKTSVSSWIRSTFLE